MPKNKKTNDEIQRIHLIGIAGLLMSSLACVAREFGYEVTGSDQDAYPPTTTILESHNIKWTNGFKTENLNSPDIVVLGNHIQQHNIELQSAIQKNVTKRLSSVISCLLFSKKYERIVPAGTHGKSTITSMLGWVFLNSSYDPTILIGAVSKNIKSNFRIGKGSLLILEGDEYISSCFDRSPKILYYSPNYAIITSAELDHVDVYKTKEGPGFKFNKFCSSVKSDGLILLCSDSPEVNQISLKDTTAKVETYGLIGNPDWEVSYIHF